MLIVEVTLTWLCSCRRCCTYLFVAELIVVVVMAVVVAFGVQLALS